MSFRSCLSLFVSKLIMRVPSKMSLFCLQDPSKAGIILAGSVIIDELRTMHFLSGLICRLHQEYAKYLKNIKNPYNTYQFDFSYRKWRVHFLKFVSMGFLIKVEAWKLENWSSFISIQILNCLRGWDLSTWQSWLLIQALM